MKTKYNQKITLLIGMAVIGLPVSFTLIGSNDKHPFPANGIRNNDDVVWKWKL
jgi:hypothetical protein